MKDISRPRRYGIWIVIALILGGGTWYGVARTQSKPKTTLETSPVSRGDLVESISSTGTLSALEEVTVGSQVSGIVTKVLVDYNDVVEKSQLLAVIDPQTLQAQATVSRATLDKAQVAYIEAERQFEEGERLVEQGYLSTRDMRSLEVTLLTAKATLASATSDLNKNTVQLKYAEIRSPIDGVIMTRSVDPGNTVQAAMTAPTLFVVASDLTRMKILASVDETQIAQIKEGMAARFTVSGIADKVFSARVRQVRLKSTTTNNVVTYTVVLDADNPDKLLFPGMTATIDFIQSNIEGQLLVPSSALRMRIPEELRVAQTADQAGAQREAGDNGAAGPPQMPADGGGPPPGFDPANGPPPGMQPPAGFQPPAAGARTPGAGGRGMPSTLWKLDEKGKAYPVRVRVIGSDLTNSAVQPLRPDTLKDGDEVVTRVIDPNRQAAASSQGNRQGQMGMGMGMPPGGGPPR